MDDSTKAAAAAPRERRRAAALSLALLLALPSAATAAAPCTQPPPHPAGAPVTAKEWNAAVHPNCFDDRLRLARWTGGTQPLAAKQSPASKFATVAENAITGGSVVVLVHGWAPGFRTAVDKVGGDLRWWSDGAVDSTGVWTSDWAWVPTTGPNRLDVTRTGVFQEIVGHDPNATVLGYSWLDNSATLDDSWTDLDLVYRSEAYTNVNGLRLAAALEQAIDPRFWGAKGNTLHLIGHSHGSKVATVAALALQSRGRRVDHLTVLDSPENSATLRANAANLLGVYLDRIATWDGLGPGGSGTFVDNYVSCFGARFGGSGNAGRVVDVVLDPKLYDWDSWGDRHSYAAAWYGGAAAAPPVTRPHLRNGLDWPPPPATSKPALDQTWPNGSQWALIAGEPNRSSCDSNAPAYVYPTKPIAITTYSKTRNVSGSPATGLVFTADTGSGVVASSFSGATPFYGSTQYGIAFDVEWTAPTPGDYLVVTGDEQIGSTREVLLVMDGRSAIAGKNPVSINAEKAGELTWLDFEVYYLPAKTNRAGKVTLSDFRRVDVDYAPGAKAPEGGPPRTASSR